MGPSNSAALVDTIWAVDSYQRLFFYSVSNPAIPALLGFVDLSGQPGSVVFRDSLAFVPTSDGRLFTVNIADPSSPSILSVLELPIPLVSAVDAAVEDTTLALACLSGFLAVSVALPDIPVPMGSLPAVDRHSAIVGSEGYLYEATSRSGLWTIQLTPDGSLLPLQNLPLGGNAHDVAVAGDRAYLALCGPLTTPGSPTGPDSVQGISIVDIQTPAAPVLVGRLKLSHVRWVRVNGDLLYALRERDSAAGQDTAVQIIRVQGDELTTIGAWRSTSTVDGWTSTGDIVYLATRDSGVIVLDCSNPVAPRVHTRLLHIAYGIAARDTVLVVMTRSGPAMDSAQVLSIAEPLNPRLLGGVSLPLLMPPSPLALTDKYAFWLSPPRAGIVDLSRPDAPVFVQPMDYFNRADCIGSVGSDFLVGAVGGLYLLRSSVSDAGPPEPEQIAQAASISCYPSPFNDQATVRVAVAARVPVWLGLYDILGRLTQVLIDNEVLHGETSLPLNAAGLASGAYVLVLRTPHRGAAHRILVLH
jgi:hypothetical protein